MYVYVIASWGTHIVLQVLNPGYNKISCVWMIKACTAFNLFGYSYTKILKKIWRMSNRIIFSSDLLMMMCLLLGPTLTTSKHTWMQNNKEDIPIFRVNPQKPVFISQEMMVHFDDCKNVILLAEVFTICGRKSIFINLKW